MSGNSALSRLQFGFSRALPLYMQTESSEAGLACLAMLATYFGNDVDLSTLRRSVAISQKGVSPTDLIKIAARIELAGRPVQISGRDARSMRHLQTPCLLCWDKSHFVVLREVGKSSAIIHDPASGERKLPLSDMPATLTAVEFTPTQSFQRKRKRRDLRLRDFMRRVVGLRRSMLQIALLAVCVQLFTIAAPLFTQWVVDYALVTGNRDLLLTLAIGFGLLLLVQVATESVRSWAVTVMSTQVNLQWSSSVFSHLLGLPLAYFEKRHIGDIMSRFNTITPIQNTLTTSLVETVVDGFLLIGVVAMMFIYNVQLLGICVVSMVLYAGLRTYLYASMRMAEQKEIVFTARQQSHFIESLRGIQTIKLFDHGEQRLTKWLNVVVDQKNCNLRTQRLSLIFRSGNALLSGLQNILIVTVGGYDVLNGSFSVGMLLAFLSYKGHFSTRGSNLIDDFFELKLLKIQTDRLADIVLTDGERDHASAVVRTGSLEPAIHARNLSFRYGQNEPRIIDGCSLSVKAGESVAIVGPSGCGKTTLMKLLLGLLSPTSGEISIGGIPLAQLGQSEYRRMVGSVMQEDCLFTGTIAENICFFSEQPDFERICEAAKTAAIHDEVVAMPVGYNTFVGDMGACLSGGQRQRILLARALYRRPLILFLDEATSYLDVANEKSVSDAVRALRVTRVIIAHRPETIASADCVFRFEKGKLVNDYRQAGDKVRELSRVV